MDAELRIWSIPNLPVMRIDHNTIHREHAASLLTASRADSVVRTSWVISRTVFNWQFSATVTLVKYFLPVTPNGFRSTNPKGIFVLRRPGLYRCPHLLLCGIKVLWWKRHIIG